MQAYWDTSALLRVYLEEPASGTARSWFRQYRVTCSRVVAVEGTGALRRRRDDGSLNGDQLRQVQAVIATDRHEWLLLDVDAATLQRAEEIISMHSVRALDAIHLATATLVAADLPPSIHPARSMIRGLRQRRDDVANEAHGGADDRRSEADGGGPDGGGDWP